MELVSMTCRNCGGKLQISKDADQIICQYCGNEYLISFNEGGISVKLLSEGLHKIQTSTDKTAAELALARLKEEKATLIELMNRQVVNPLISEDIIQLSNKIFNPYKLQAYLEKMLNEEEHKSILSRNKNIIDQLKRRVAICSELLQKYKKAEEQEFYNSEIVNRK